MTRKCTLMKRGPSGLRRCAAYKQVGFGSSSFGGYTQYWSHGGFTTAQWKKLLAATKKIISAATRNGILIAGPHGTGKPEPTRTHIALNGVGLGSHESFFLSRAPQDFEFCKTAEKPYDAVVVSIMAVAKKINKTFEPRSDGGPSAIRKVY